MHPCERLIWDRRKVLAGFGIDLRMETHGAHLLWCHSQRVAEALKTEGPPIVIDDQRDSATLRNNCRVWMRLDRVRVVVKATAYCPLSLYNQPHCDMTIHGAIIQQTMPDPPTGKSLMPLTADAMMKLAIGFGYQYFSRYDCLKAEPLADRDIDVFFMGTTTYGMPTIQWHRRRMVEELERSRTNYVLATSRSIPYPEYIQLLRRSKIVLCPWGIGERTHREMEAWLAGCVVMRPDTSFATSWPDLYRRAGYVRCRPDWNDLRDRLAEILPGWRDFVDPAARDMILSAREDEQFGSCFSHLVEQSA